MKKNKLMRLASCLLVGTLLTTCAISGTFAKYTTQDAAADSARVAKWGVQLQIIGDLYSDSYLNTSTVYTPNEEGTGISVQAKDEGVNVVAPGTEDNDGLTIKLNGTPEVDYEFEVKMTTQNIYLAAGTYGVMIAVDAGVLSTDNFQDINAGEQLYTENAGVYSKVAASDAYDATKTYYTLEDTVVNDETYWPVVYNLTANDANLANQLKTEYVNGAEPSTMKDGTNENTLQAIAGMIAKSLNGGTEVQFNQDASNVYTVEFTSGRYDTNTNIADLFGLSHAKLDWAWNFTDMAEVNGDTVNDVNGDDADEHDGLDTILGNLQAARTSGETINVVKANGETFEAPKMYEDYCLDTQFALDITVNQMD